MAKKRKAAGRSLKQASAVEDGGIGTSHFAANTTFTDSEDEFEAGRDRILLDETPEAKRRRKSEEKGLYSSFCNVIDFDVN